MGDHQAEVDDYIRRFARDWSLERMPTVDRTLLRMGVYELLYRPDVPTGAVISEAVELAQRYSTDESGRFVNGMLGRIAEEVRGAEARLVIRVAAAPRSASGPSPPATDGARRRSP